tara:strand:+ start:2964 stop:4463 length:1500 start_codon:yes stop_codon:yes gene_type:complete
MDNANRRIALVSPQVISDKNQVRKAQPPLGMAYLAAVLEENGYAGNVLCIDAVVEGYDTIVELNDDPNFVQYGLETENIVRRLENFDPDLIGITSLFSSMTECAFSVANGLKKRFPNTPLLMGGNHASNTAVDIMREVTCIDFVLKGEAEYTFLEFSDKYFSGQNYFDVDGLVYRKNKKIISNPSPAFNKKLDDLPDPAFHLFPMERYFEIGMPHNPFVKSGRVGSIMTSRGCPEHCYFCTSPEFTGNAFRALSAVRVAELVEKLITKFNIKELQILDDNFTVNYKRVIDICQRIAEFNLRITLPNAVRADMPVNRGKRAKMYRAMASAGFEQFAISVEHGDQDFLNEVTKKRLDHSEVLATCQIAHDEGLLVHANFMMGFPFETKILREATANFARKMDADSYSVSLTQPLPGTPIWDLVKENNLFVPNFKVTRMTYTNVNIVPHDIAPDQLKLEAENLNQELNDLGRERRKASREKYQAFSMSGKNSSGDRKYALTK